MKKALLPLFFLMLAATQLHAIIILPYITQTQYRWRNDDGNETSATWRAAANTAITVGDTTTVLRLRIELNNNSGGGAYDVDETLEYSSNGGTSWTPITNSPSNAFWYVSSALVANGDPTTNQMGTSTPATFVAGRIISTVSAATPMSLNANKTEYEWVIRPTGNVQPLTTYTFRVANLGITPVQYPELTTTCVGAYITDHSDSAHCGPGILELKAETSAGNTINWYATASSTTVLGTGNSFLTPYLTSTKVYYAAAAFGTACEGPRVPVTATIHPVPVVNLGSDITVCAGDPATFNAGSFNAYLWDDGSTMATRTADAPGTYYVTVTGVGGCKDSDTIKLLNNPRPVVDLGEDIFICPGVTATLDAGNPGKQFLWDDGTVTQTRDVTATGTYSVAVTNEYNCTGTDAVNVTVKDEPLGTLNAVHGLPATYTFTVLNPQFAVGYVWDFGDGSPQGSGQMTQHTYTTNGIYEVRLLIQGDCGTNAERVRTVDVFDAGGTTGIRETGAADYLLIYPNPAKDQLTVEAKPGVALRAVAVYNILGQRLKNESPATSGSYVMAVGDLAAGVYSLRIETDKGVVIRKFEVLQ